MSSFLGENADRLFFDIVGSEIAELAVKSGLPSDLTDEEMKTFRTCLEAGMECWQEVVQLALAAATVERSAASRATAFAATGEIDVLLAGLDKEES